MQCAQEIEYWNKPKRYYCHRFCLCRFCCIGSFWKESRSAPCVEEQVILKITKFSAGCGKQPVLVKTTKFSTVCWLTAGRLSRMPCGTRDYSSQWLLLAEICSAGVWQWCREPVVGWPVVDSGGVGHKRRVSECRLVTLQPLANTATACVDTPNCLAVAATGVSFSRTARNLRIRDVWGMLPKTALFWTKWVAKAR